MKSIVINQLEPPVSIYGDTGTTIPTTLIVSGWTGSTYTLSGLSDTTIFYTLRIVKQNCDDLVKTFSFTVTPTPTPTNSPTPSLQQIITWYATECNCVKTVTCPDGYTLSNDKSYCYSVITTTPTEGTPLTVNNRTHSAYSNYGARIYQINGYNNAGAPLAGFTPTIVTTRPLWGNSLSNNSDGRLNNVGVWAVNNCTLNNFQPITEWIGFAATVTIPEKKIYYIGIAGDNQIRFKVNNLTIVEQQSISDSQNFKYWHIYPVYLQDGPNFIELECRDDGSISASFGAEIYNNTEAELIAATLESDLTRVFSTKDYFCNHITVGTNYGYSCPDGYTIDTTGTPICKKRDEISSIEVQTGYIHCNGRGRLINGISDGYFEPNDSSSGLGPYFPDTLNPDLCTVQGVDPTPTPSTSFAVTPTPSITPTITPSASSVNFGNPCLIYVVDAIVETVYLNLTNTDFDINIVGLTSGSYGPGSTYFAFSIATSNCRPCVDRSGTLTLIKRGTLETYTLNYTVTSTGAVYLSGGFLPVGFVYDGVISDTTNCTSIGCLIKGTRLTMADGNYKNIEDVVIGDELMSLSIDGFNDLPESWSSDTFISYPSLTVVKDAKEIINKTLYQINDVLVSSPEHRHFIKREATYYFEQANLIVVGDILLNESGVWVRVDKITVVHGLFETYTLDVEDLDVYFANGLLTHNKNIIETP
jgi:hypothetical protein